MWRSIKKTDAIRGLAFSVHSAGHDWSVKRYGDHVRFELRSGDRWLRDKGPVERAQISSQWKLPYGREVWLSFSLKIERGAPISTGWTSLVGLHQSEDPQDAPSSGCFTLHTNKNEFLLITRSSQQDPLIDRAPDTVRWRSPLERAQWLMFVMRFVVDPYGQGAFQMWLNGTEVVRAEPIPLGYVDAVGPYLKFGYYRPCAPELTIVHIANIEIDTNSLVERVRSPLPIIDGPE